MGSLDGCSPRRRIAAQHHLLQDIARNICEAIVTLIRDLHHFPTFHELRLRRRVDSSFPGRAALSRIGGKTDLIQLVMDYAVRRPGHDDILSICQHALGQASNSLSRGPQTKYAYVYLLLCGKYHKIGRSERRYSRAAQLELQRPDEIFLVHAIRTDDAPGIEAYWHRRFADKRVKGEWFNLTVADVRAFKRRTIM